MFSDECTMQQFATSHMHIRRSLGNDFDKKYVVATVKHSTSQMSWGAMSCHDAAAM